MEMQCKTKSEAMEIFQALSACHPNATCELHYGTPYELLVAVILSAQCTDKRVNQITPNLFPQYNTPESMLQLSQAELEQIIYSCGFYHNKAKNILAASQDILQRFQGKVPDTLAELMTLAGVGRKTANVVYSVAFHGNAFAVDTHVFRVSNRIGLVAEKNEVGTERALCALFPEEKWSAMHHLLIFHGRYVCKSQKPNCQECCIQNWCNEYRKERN